MSTGMSSLADVDISLRTLLEAGATSVTLLHCTTNYPCPYADVNLKAMLTLKEAFHLPVGYSDHTVGREVSVAAVALGATVIEKHFTLDCAMEGPDHAASTPPEAFAALVQAIRNTEIFLGDGAKMPTTAEKEISKVVTKRIVAARPIKAGETFTQDNLCVKRNDVGEPAIRWEQVLGRIAQKDYHHDEGILV